MAPFPLKGLCFVKEIQKEYIIKDASVKKKKKQLKLNAYINN